MTMGPNPVLKKLGLGGSDRVAIIHTDDIGMCLASVNASIDLNQVGIISSGAIMVPCPWFLHAAQFARDHPKADYGVHLDLTSEWKTYRWGPISTRDLKSGMIDEEGYFYHRSEEVQEHGDQAAVELELAAQIERLINAGVVPTHIDTHMGSVAHPKFMQSYIGLGMKYGFPSMIFRFGEDEWRSNGLDANTAQVAAGMMQQLEASGLPLLDALGGMPLDTDENRLERTKKMLSDLKPGITHFIIHPSKDTPELRAITPDWKCRVADYQDFMNEELRKHIKQIGLYIIGYRELKNLMPKA